MGEGAPGVVTTYIEIVPTDTVKYERDKTTGILRMDRPQQYSNVCPSLYGFIPRSEATHPTRLRSRGSECDLGRSSALFCDSGGPIVAGSWSKLWLG